MWIKQCDSQLIHSNITDLQLADSHLIHPNTLNSKTVDHVLISTVSNPKSDISATSSDAFSTANPIPKKVFKCYRICKI